MDENNPSTCCTFLQHEAAYRSRLFKRKHEKRRLSARDLLSACVKLVDDYNCEALPDIAPDDHAKFVMPTLNVNDTNDQIFLTQVLYGCCRYKRLLDILIAKLFLCKSPNVQCIDQTLYNVLGYLVLIRLEELTFDNLRKFILSQHAQKMLPFMQFVFSQENLSNDCKPEWIEIYDTEYVDSLITNLTNWRAEAEELTKRLEERVFVVKDQGKGCTTLEAFNLSKSQKKRSLLDENKAPLPPPRFKAKPPPTRKEGPTPIQKALEAACQESRENLAKFYSSPENQPFHLRILERPSKFAALKEKIEAVQKMETEYIPPKARPCPEPPTNSVKLTTSAMTREYALYQKQLDEERRRLQAFEIELRNDFDYKLWQREMKSRDEMIESVHRRCTKASVDACDQAAADARNTKVEENRETGKKVKEESQKLGALKEEFLINLELFNRLQRENIQEGQKAVKSAMINIAQAKKERAREIQAETTKLVSICASERANELARRKELIQHLHTLEVESSRIEKKFDRDSVAGHGLLGEMSISELQARLALVKQAIKKEEDVRRSRINVCKEENQKKILDKSAFVQKMRKMAHARRMARKDAAEIVSYNDSGEQPPVEIPKNDSFCKAKEELTSISKEV